MIAEFTDLIFLENVGDFFSISVLTILTITIKLKKMKNSIKMGVLP